MPMMPITSAKIEESLYKGVQCGHKRSCSACIPGAELLDCVRAAGMEFGTLVPVCSLLVRGGSWGVYDRHTHEIICWYMGCAELCAEDMCGHLQDKLTPSEELGDLMRRAGDNDAALGIYQKANVPQKVIEGLAAKGDFEALSKFR